MKKISFFVLSLMSFALLFSASSFAGSFDSIFTTDSYGSLTPKNNFNTNQQPYLYLKLPNPGVSFKGAFWNDPSNLSYFSSEGPSTAQEVWLTPLNWSSIVKEGEWTVNAAYFTAGSTPDFGTGTYKFSVNPEPISASLFLVGGLALAGRQFSKKRKTAVTA